MENKNKRLVSLDIFRGLTVALMIIVNNPGDYKSTFIAFKHSVWEGFPPAEMVFPFFVVIMGISMYTTLRKYDFTFSAGLSYKILKRTILLFLIGFLLNIIDDVISGYFSEGNNQSITGILFNIETWKNVRILGVLQRLALCYGIGSFLIIYIKERGITIAAYSILIVYTIVLFIGNGFESSENNIVSVVDRCFLGKSHLYALKSLDGGRIALDPEGILGTFSATAQLLLGFMLGKIMFSTNELQNKIQKLFIVGTIWVGIGYLFSYMIPVIKVVWSPTYVLLSTGAAALLWALLIKLVDVKNKKKKLFVTFGVFGINPLALYVFSELIVIPVKTIKITVHDELYSLRGYIFQNVLSPIFGHQLGSFIFSLSILLICWLLGYLLYKKNIYIKI